MRASSDFSRFGLMPRDDRRYPCGGSVQAVGGWSGNRSSKSWSWKGAWRVRGLWARHHTTSGWGGFVCRGRFCDEILCIEGPASRCGSRLGEFDSWT